MLAPIRIILATVAAGAGMALPPSQAAAGEEVVISAFMAWEGEGQVVRTAADQATFVGSFSGIVYVNTENGPVEAGQMVCPAVVRIDRESGEQTGNGNCTMTAADGAQLFSELACTGVHLVGCGGEMKLIGGSARFDGVSGSGAFTLRSSIQEVEVSPSASTQAAHGIIFWPNLHYKLPDGTPQ
jgi:hypothetical protein